MVIQSAINSFDDPGLVAASAASANIEMFIYAAANAFTQTAISFVGQNYGAAQCRRVDRIMGWCLGFSTASGVILGVLCTVFGRQLAGIYVPGEEEVITQAVVRMTIICAPYFLGSLMDTAVGVLRGLGYSVGPMITSLVGVCGLRLVWVATVFRVFHTPEVLYISYPVTWTVTAAIHITVFFCVRRRAYGKVDPTFRRIRPVKAGK